MTDPQPDERSIFLHALEIASAAERAAYLDAACGDDRRLRDEVDGLLRAHGLPQPLLDAPDALPTTLDEPGVGREGAVVGNYRLLQEIGEGGMGSVWLAEQTHPVKRRVALKLIKAGMDSRTVLARFEAERQALALMDHPNIARVFDGGLTEGGRPFFVMELVNGLPLTQFCDEAKCTTRERLELFVPVCQAIQHAHQKGIVHRDLKPSNVLVTLYDGRPVPKVIDFGVAKATGGKLTEETVSTAYGTVVGTLEYMAPEQAGFSALDVDTRADIYSLGVILYELLTGLRPFDATRLKQAALDEVLRIIRQEDPPRPSTRLSTAASLPTLAAARRTQPGRLRALMRGELDWVVMRCLEKDRARRYETASGLARDIQRYLADEPVEARPPSTRYLARMFLRRNRGPALAAGLVLLAMVGGIVGTTFGLIRAEQQRRIAQAKEQEAVAAAEQERQARDREAGQRRVAEERKQQAEANEKKAVAEKQIAEAVGRFLQRDLLRQADPVEQADAVREQDGEFEVQENPTIKELLGRAAAELTPGKIEAKFPGQRAVQASILRTVGDAYRGIGEYGQAVTFLTRSADTYRDAFGADHPDTLATLNSLATAYKAAGQVQRAIELHERVRDAQVRTLPADHPDTLATLNSLARAYKAAGMLRRAIELHEQVRGAQLRTLGADHPDTLTTQHYLALVYRASGEPGRAIELLEQVRDVRVRTLGADHPHTLFTLHSLAETYQQRVRMLPRAIELHERVREARVRVLGADHPDTLTTLNVLAQAYQASGKRDQALPLFRQAAEGVEKLKFLHQHAGRIVVNLADCYAKLGQYAEAETWRRKWLAVVKKRAEPPVYANQLAALGRLLLKQNKWADAQPVFRECLAIRVKIQPDAWNVLRTRSMLGASLLGQGKFAEAEPLLLTSYEGMRRYEKAPPQGKAQLAEAADWLVELYTATGKPTEAAKWRLVRAGFPPERAPPPRPAPQ